MLAALLSTDHSIAVSFAECVQEIVTSTCNNTASVLRKAGAAFATSTKLLAFHSDDNDEDDDHSHPDEDDEDDKERAELYGDFHGRGDDQPFYDPPGENNDDDDGLFNDDVGPYGHDDDDDDSWGMTLSPCQRGLQLIKSMFAGAAAQATLLIALRPAFRCAALVPRLTK